MILGILKGLKGAESIHDVINRQPTRDEMAHIHTSLTETFEEKPVMNRQRELQIQ